MGKLDIVNKINNVNSLVQRTKELVSMTSDESAEELTVLIANTEKPSMTVIMR